MSVAYVANQGLGLYTDSPRSSASNPHPEGHCMTQDERYRLLEARYSRLMSSMENVMARFDTIAEENRVLKGQVAFLTQQSQQRDQQHQETVQLLTRQNQQLTQQVQQQQARISNLENRPMVQRSGPSTCTMVFNTSMGVLVGAGTGAVIGGLVAGPPGAICGAIIGGTIGGGVAVALTLNCS